MALRNIGLDVETTKIPRHLPWIEGSYLVTVGMVDEHGWDKIWVFNHEDLNPGSINQSLCLRQIQSELDSAPTRLVGHNLKFDLQWLTSIGVDWHDCKLWCTQVADYVLNGQRKMDRTLATLSLRHGITPKIDRVKMMWDSGYETDEIPLDTILNPYLEQDCINTLAIFQRQTRAVKDTDLERAMALQMELLGILTDMEHNGALMDGDLAQRYLEEYRLELSEVESQLYLAFGREFNLASTDQLSAMLYGGDLVHDVDEVYLDTRNCTYREPYLFRYKDPNKEPVTKYRSRTLRELIVKTRRGKRVETVDGVFKPPTGSEVKKEGYYSVSKNTLSQLRPRSKKQRTILGLLEKHSGISKVIETFHGDNGAGLINKQMPDGCVHASYMQSITATGRLSCRDPNGQNFPRKGTSPIKRVFIPRFDKILNADLSQLEWRVAAFLSQDPVAIREILDDVDYHRDNAIRFFGADPSLPNDHPDFKPLRTIAKVFGFRLLYGGSAYGMYMDHNMPNYSLSQWQEIVDGYYRKYVRLAQWQNEIIMRVYQHGVLKNPTGRLFSFYRFKKANRRGELYNHSQIKNYPVQGLAAEVTAIAMCLINQQMRRCNLKSLMILQVHDSIVFDVPDEEIDQLARICMEVFTNLDKTISKFYGLSWNVPLSGDVEVGPNYGDVEAWK